MASPGFECGEVGADLFPGFSKFVDATSQRGSTTYGVSRGRLPLSVYVEIGGCGTSSGTIRSQALSVSLVGTLVEPVLSA